MPICNLSIPARSAVRGGAGGARISLFRAVLAVVLSLFLASTAAVPAHAHEMAYTVLTLNQGEEGMSGSVQIPADALALALDDRTWADLSLLDDVRAGQLTAYVQDHFAPTTTDGWAWTVLLADWQATEGSQNSAGDYGEYAAELILTAPAGANQEVVELGYDAVVEQLVTHRIMVLTGGTGQIGGTPGEDGAAVLGVVSTDSASGEVQDLRIDLGAGIATETGTAVAAGDDSTTTTEETTTTTRMTETASVGGVFTNSVFLTMAGQGVHHISGGTDHMLFLLTLLIPAPLLAVAGHWRSPVAGRAAVRRILGVTLAFTVGHSVSLMLSVLTRWSAPAQPIEILIAVSILISAAHAFRPIFPGREVVVAGVFGLVHGLAFAFELIELGVGTGSLIVSVLGFNLGIELMQLLVVAVLLPPLVVLAPTRAYRPLRVVAACMAAAAAFVWIVDRIVGWESAAAIADSLRWVGPVAAVCLWAAALTLLARQSKGKTGPGSVVSADRGSQESRRANQGIV